MSRRVVALQSATLGLSAAGTGSEKPCTRTGSGGLPEELQLGGCDSDGERKLGEVCVLQRRPAPPAQGPGAHPEGDGQGSCFFPGVPAGGGGASSEASFKHRLLGTQPAGRKGVGSMLKARFL